MDFIIVSTLKKFDEVLHDIWGRSENCVRRGVPFLLAVDLEGMDSRQHVPTCEWLSLACTTSLAPEGVFGSVPDIWLVDLRSLGNDVWARPTLHGKTLAELFSDPVVTKLMWDVRYDIHTLVRSCGVMTNASSVIDLQLAYMFSKGAPREYLSPLGPKTLVELFYGKNDRLTSTNLLEMFTVEKTARAMWRARDGGDISVWQVRPTNRILQAYACIDVAFLHDIAVHLCGCLCAPEVRAETIARIEFGARVSAWAEVTGHRMALSPSAHWTFEYKDKVGLDCSLVRKVSTVEP